MSQLESEGFTNKNVANNDGGKMKMHKKLKLGHVSLVVREDQFWDKKPEIESTVFRNSKCHC
jgi:hypothetical protein